MLDQQQTIANTSPAFERDYNLITFDGMHTERIATKADGSPSTLRIDHTVDEKKATRRHLVGLTNVVTVGGEKKQLTINVTVQHPADMTLDGGTEETLPVEVKAFLSWLASEDFPLIRWLTLES
jgi:hypothetical protein